MTTWWILRNSSLEIWSSTNNSLKQVTYFNRFRKLSIIQCDRKKLTSSQAMRCSMKVKYWKCWKLVLKTQRCYSVKFGPTRGDWTKCLTTWRVMQLNSATVVAQSNWVWYFMVLRNVQAKLVPVCLKASWRARIRDSYTCVNTLTK